MTVENRTVDASLGPLDLAAALAAVVIVVVAPFMGLVRDALFSALGPDAVPRLATALAVAAALLGAFALGVVMRGPRRVARIGLLAVALALALLAAGGLSTGHASTDVVEQIHVFEYGGLAMLLYWAQLGRARRATGRAVADWVSYAAPLLGCAAVALADEGTQWLFQLRVGEIRDVALDVAAAGAGLLAGIAIRPPARGLVRTWLESRRRRIWRLAALVVSLLAVFVDVAHLGHWVVDPEWGRFRSHFRADELRAESADRAERWSSAPPRSLAAHHLEDRFLSEAAMHAGHRNERLRAGDPVLALQANRVLERWYDPFLDLDSFRGAGRHRWSEAQRAEIAARAAVAQPDGVDPAVYVSPVLAGRVWPTGEPVRWAWRVGAWALAAACWIASRRPLTHRT